LSSNSGITGTVAASVTPLREGGNAIDFDTIPPLVDFLAGSGLTGVLAMGTTGEGILLNPEERRQTAERFVEQASGRLKVFIHCGAQTTSVTAELAAHAAEIGADAVAVMPPPYFALDDRALLAHLREAANACEPLPFYLYEFKARAGYSIPLQVIDELRTKAPNLTGIKVSTTPWEIFEPYLIEDLDIFVGPERFIHRGISRGAVGAVSALAAALPEVVVAAVQNPTPETAKRCEDARTALENFPLHASLKRILARRGVPVAEDVRGPLRTVEVNEAGELDKVIDELLRGGL
jgi:dihydrodipicolinate synthase/N-acetylneuraminate lyase